MKRFSRALLAAGVLALATPGCRTAKQTCEMKVPNTMEVFNKKDCKLEDPKAQEHCEEAMRATRSHAMSACLTQESGVAMTCLEDTSGEGFECSAK